MLLLLLNNILETYFNLNNEWITTILIFKEREFTVNLAQLYLSYSQYI